MVDDGGRGAPHGMLLALVVGAVVSGPFLVGDGGEALMGAISDLLSPAGLLLLPVSLLLIIRFLSSDRGTALADLLPFGGGSPDSIHRVGGSPVGVALLLVLLLFLLYNRVSLFGDGDDAD